MRVAIIHGYFLHDSGSAIYTRELARELTRAGHEVTLVCQEQRPQDFNFIDTAYELAAGNRSLSKRFKRQRRLAGSCRLVRPHIGGRLLTYVPGPFPGFTAVPFQEAATHAIDDYVAANVLALRTVCEAWPADFIQTNHLVMQPVIARRALEGRSPYVVTFHGSELNFSIRNDDRLVPYALEGLEGAAAVFALSQASLEDLAGFFLPHGLDLEGRARELPPGVDTARFSPDNDRAGLPEAVYQVLARAGSVAVFAGRLLWTKGFQYVVAALPLILAERPDFHLLVAGEGPMREAIDSLIDSLARGDYAAALDLLAAEPQLRPGEGYGEVLPPMSTADRDLYLRAAAALKDHVHFLGHVDHDRLAALLAAADVSLAPSVFPEAFGMVSIEALAAGALPVATYQTGLRTPLNAAAALLGDDALRNLRPGVPLTTAIAGEVLHLLAAYPTSDVLFRRRLHGLAKERFSWSVMAARMLEAAGEH